MKIALVTLCLNEAEFIAHNYEQHKGWPGLTNLIYVEGADPFYARANHQLVSPSGLSTDGTSQILLSLAITDSRVRYLPYGWFKGRFEPDQMKCDGRNQYLREIGNDEEPDYFLVVDADEFYPKSSQVAIMAALEELKDKSFSRSYIINQRHIWTPPSIQLWNQPFNQEVIGGYWGIPHARLFYWPKHEEINYKTNHNYPEWHLRTNVSHIIHSDVIQCVHMGFAKTLDMRAATNRYYQERGEGKEDGFNRQKYVDCRAAWETWQPGDTLPHGAKVIPYDGPIPEVFDKHRSP